MRTIAILSTALGVAGIAVFVGRLSAFSDDAETPVPLSSGFGRPPALNGGLSPERNPRHAEYVKLAIEHADLLSMLATEGEFAKAVEELRTKVVEAKAQLKAREESAEKRLSEIKQSLRQLVIESGCTPIQEKAQRALQVLDQPSPTPQPSFVPLPIQPTPKPAQPTLAPPRD